MILGKKENGQNILLRCGCSHNWAVDKTKYQDHVYGEYKCTLCKKCKFWGWRIKGMTDDELRRPEID
jgi:hypothetical protein